MQIPLLIFIFLLSTLDARTIKPKTVKAKDRTSRHRGHRNTQETILLSTFQATSEISIQITSVVTLEISTEATSGQPRGNARVRYRSEVEFLNNNRFKITEDISNGDGEHLITLMGMMHLQKNHATLAKVQSNFENLLSLEDEAFLLKLREISEVKSS